MAVSNQDDKEFPIFRSGEPPDPGYTAAVGKVRGYVLFLPYFKVNEYLLCGSINAIFYFFSFLKRVNS